MHSDLSDNGQIFHDPTFRYTTLVGSQPIGQDAFALGVCFMTELYHPPPISPHPHPILFKLEDRILLGYSG